MTVYGRSQPVTSTTGNFPTIIVATLNWHRNQGVSQLDFIVAVMWKRGRYPLMG